MPSFSHSSLSSTVDEYGNRLTLSINPASMRLGRDAVYYKGRARSTGGYHDERDGQILIAKFTEQRSTTSERWAEKEVMKTDIAKMDAVKFNNTMYHLIKQQKDSRRKSTWGRRSPRNSDITEFGGCEDIEFQTPLVAEIDNVAFYDQTRRPNETFLILNQFPNLQSFIPLSACPGDRKKRGKVSTLLETFKLKKTRSNSVKENSSGATLSCVGRVRASKSESDKDDASFPTFNNSNFDDPPSYNSVVNDLPPSYESLYGTPLLHKRLHAFVHHFFCYHNGEMVIDGLKGQYDEESGYSLTVPFIHSKDGRFGIQDEGVEGIRRVVNSHTCSDLCRHLPKMSLDTTTPLHQERQRL